MNQKEHKDRLEEIFWEKFNGMPSMPALWNTPSSDLDNRILEQIKNKKDRKFLPFLFFFGFLIISSFIIYLIAFNILKKNTLQVRELFNVNINHSGQDEVNGVDIIFCDSSIYKANNIDDTKFLQASLLMDKIDSMKMKSLNSVEQSVKKVQGGSKITRQNKVHHINNDHQKIGSENNTEGITNKVESSIAEQNNDNIIASFIDNKKLQEHSNINFASLVPLKKDYTLLFNDTYALSDAPLFATVPKKVKQHNWLSEMVVGKFVNLGTTTFSTTVENIDLTVTKSIQANSFGTNIERKINNRLSLGLGIHHLSSSFVTDYGMKVAYDIANEEETLEGYINSIQQVIPSLYYDIYGTMLLFRPKHSILLGSTDIPMSLSLYQKMSSWSFPIYARIMLSPQSRKWTTYAKIGLAPNLIQNKISITNYAVALPINNLLQLEQIGLEFMVNTNILASKLEINYLLSAGVRYGIVNQCYFFVEPSIQGSLNTAYAISNLQSKNSIFAGTLLGIGAFF